MTTERSITKTLLRLKIRMLLLRQSATAIAAMRMGSLEHIICTLDN